MMPHITIKNVQELLFLLQVWLEGKHRIAAVAV